jgi:hypothetical protein
MVCGCILHGIADSSIEKHPLTICMDVKRMFLDLPGIWRSDAFPHAGLECERQEFGTLSIITSFLRDNFTFHLSAFIHMKKLRVFLCHASQDKPAVRKLYASLKSEPWIDPWLDEENLLLGQDWG